MNLLHLYFWQSPGNMDSYSNPRKFASFSLVVSTSSNCFINNRYVNCSITSSGFVIPPVQNISHILSILFLSSPVIIFILHSLFVNYTTSILCQADRLCLLYLLYFHYYNLTKYYISHYILTGILFQ